VVATLDPDAPRDETVDLDRLFGPLWVRAPVAGDRFAPLGMDGKSTPLNDFFRGRRVPRGARSRVPLVCDRFGIVWVVGHRIAHRVRLTEQTQRKVGLRWEPRAEAGQG
jgi:tRNA(Ile)-lysidine synthase